MMTHYTVNGLLRTCANTAALSPGMTLADINLESAPPRNHSRSQISQGKFQRE